MPAASPETALFMRDLLCETLEREMRTTQAVIAAVPEFGRDYRHEPRARSAFDLAWHIASSQVMILESVAAGGFDFQRPKPAPPAAIREIVLWYAEHGAAALTRVRSLSAEALLKPLAFRNNITLPAYQFLLLGNDHAIHHRGQLSTYLRPLGARVPAIYGESADSVSPGSSAAR